jgi:cytochrome c oxidase subunit 2
VKDPSILTGAGDQGQRIAQLWWVMFALAIAVYVVVGGLVVIAILRGRRGEPARRSKPRRIRWDENATIVFGGLVVPAVVLFIVGVLTVQTTASADVASRSGLQIDVVARRWFWDVRYPAARVVTANEIRVPVGTPLTFRLRSDDVIHSFWVPDIAGKVDTIPGQTNYLHTTVKRAGTYLGLCAEYCSIQHANMRFNLIAMPPAAFDRWLARRQGASAEPTDETEAAGQRIFAREACAGCHTIRGVSRGTVGPDLTDLGERGFLGAMTLRNTPQNLAAWIRDSQHLKRGNVMPPFELAPADLDALVAYLASLR